MTNTTRPEQPGWYRTADSSNWMLYSLDTTGRWSAHVLNGEAMTCEWTYIDQAGPVEMVSTYPVEVSA